MTKKLSKNNLKFQTKSLAFKIVFTLLSIAIITAIIIAANSRLSTPAGSAFESFPTHCRYEWVDQSGTKSADGKAHEVYVNAGDTIPMYLTIRNRNIDPLALVMYGIPPQGTLLPEVAPHRGGHEFRIGVKDDEILSWINPSSFYPNPDGDDNRFAVYDGPDANVGDELILTWNLKIKDDIEGTYNLYTGIVREFDNWPWQVDVYGSVIPGGSDIFWKFIISPSEPDPEIELDKIEIVDSNGVALNSFEINEEDNKQFYARAYDTDGKDITSNTDFTWSINSQYNPVDVGYITQTGLYTSGTTADFYLGAIRLMGSYNNRTDSDAVSVTIGEVPPFGGDPELDKVEILDSNGASLPSFNIDQDTDRQLYVKAYDTSGNNITLDTDFTWSIDSKYSSTDVGTITSPGGLYTSGVKAGLYTGAIKVSGLYNEISKLDTANVTINEPGIELDRVEITDSAGSPLPSFDIDQDTDKQLYAKAYSTTNEDITSETDFTWSINNQYNPTDIGTITSPCGLYTSGSTAGFYSGALRLVGSYNQKDVLDTVSVTIIIIPATRVETHLVAYFAVNPTSFEYIAERFNAIIGSFPYGVYVVDGLKPLNPNIITLGYRDAVIMHEINDTHGDWAEVNAHEDWFLHEVECTPNPSACSPDNRMLKEPDAYIMDVGNTGWQTHYITYVVGLLNNPAYVNYDGVFADDVWATIPWHPDVSIKARWPSNMVDMVTHIKNYLPANKIVVTNSGLNYQILDVADGVMNEGFVHAPWSDDYTFRTVSEWQGDIEALIYGVANNKTYMAQSGMIGDKANQNQKQEMMLFTLASYLMGSGDSSTYSFKDYDEPGYNKMFFYSEWDTDLGTPIESYGLMPGESNIYKRTFSKGLVLVNPSNTANNNLLLGKNYKTLGGVIVDTIDMPAHSGVILLNV